MTFFRVAAIGLLLMLTFSRVFAFGLIFQDEDNEWEQFKMKHKKQYNDNEEESMRRQIYLENKKAIEAHNKLYHDGAHKTLLEMNHFGDMALEEFALLLTGLMGYKPMIIPSINNDFWTNLSENVPSSIDWREMGVVTPVKNQGKCGSCWAFSATGSLEGQHALKTGDLVSLSEQNLIDCNQNLINNGCNGGNMDNAFQYVTLNDGIDTEESYPYTGKDGHCHYTNDTAGATADGFRNIPSGSEDILKDVVGKIGPVSVAIDAKGLLFQFYKDGVYYNPFCSSTHLNHGVLVVGYDSTDDDDDYWIVKNSWGPLWGDNGYIYMSRNKDNNCGIATAASFPTMDRFSYN